MAQEAAPIGIAFIPVEPGPVRAVLQRSFAIHDNPARMVRAMIDCADATEAPRRLLLGRDAFDRVRAALVERLSALDRQREVALSTEADD